MSTVTAIRDVLTSATDEMLTALERLDDRMLGYEGSDYLEGLSDFIYVHQIPQIIEWSLLDPKLWGRGLCFTGPSAIGKTDAVQQGFAQAAAAMGREPRLHVLHVSQMGPVDVTGVPREERAADGAPTERTMFYPPRHFPTQKALPLHQVAVERFQAEYRQTGQANWAILHDFPLYGIFWDEVTNPSSPNVVHQAFSLWYGNFVGDSRLVDDTPHITAGNRAQDQTNSIDMPRSFVSRFCMIPVAPSLAGWIANWALKMEVGPHGTQRTREHPAVISFLHDHSRFFAPDAGEAVPMEGWPAPRPWSFVSRLMWRLEEQPLPDELVRLQVIGHVGQNAGHAFMKYVKHWRELIDVNRLLDSPQVGDGPFGWLPQEWISPHRQDLLMMTGLQMIASLRKENARRFMAFILDETKFPRDFSILLFKMLQAAKKIDSLADEWAPREFSAWCARDHSSVI